MLNPQITYLTIYLILVAISVSRCGLGSESSTSDNSVAVPSAEVSIDAATIVPVVNGVSTQSQLYIRNNSDTAVSNISYTLANASVLSQNSKSDSIGAGLTSEDENGFKLITTQDCLAIPAHGYCAITFATPNLQTAAT